MLYRSGVGEAGEAGGLEREGSGEGSLGGRLMFELLYIFSSARCLSCFKCFS